MEYLLPFLATRCILDSGTIKARYLHRAFCTYLSEHGHDIIDRATFLEWMRLRAPEFIYSSTRRTFSGLALIPVVSPNKRPSPEPSISPRKRCKNQIISSSDPLPDSGVLTVDPLMFIDRTNMPVLTDRLTKEAYQAYRQWNVTESERLQHLKINLSTPSDNPTVSVAETVETTKTTETIETTDTSPPRNAEGLAEIQASLEAMQQLLARELESIHSRYEQTIPYIRPIRIGSSRPRIRSPSQTEMNRSRINSSGPIDIFAAPERQSEPPVTMATSVPEVVVHSDEETPLLPRVELVHPLEPEEINLPSGTTGPEGPFIQ